MFGTLVEVLILGAGVEEANAALGSLFQEFDRMHRTYHAWQRSPLTQLNESFAIRAPAMVTPEFHDILADARNWAVQSNDLFNPAIGGLVRAWGFHKDNQPGQLADPADIKHWVESRPRMSDLLFRKGGVETANPAVQIDLGGYLKGWALDFARRHLEKADIHDALINLGGNVSALGERGYRPWRVGIQHPRKQSAMASLDLYDMESIGTSGDYQRFFTADGKRYCHIIDPRTGYPAQGVQSVTIITQQRKGALSDLGSKPLFITAKERWREEADRLGIDYVMIVHDNGQIEMTDKMRARVNLI